MSAYGGYGRREYEMVEVYAERLQYASRDDYDVALKNYLTALQSITSRRTFNDADKIAEERRAKVERDRQLLAIRAATKKKSAADRRNPNKRRIRTAA